MQRQAAAGHTPGGDRAVDTAGKQVEGTAAGAHRQAAGGFHFGAVDVGGVVADLDHNFQLGVVHVHPQVMVLVQQVGAQLPADFGALHRVGLVGALGFHLKGADAPQRLAQVGFGGLADGVEVLGALHRAAHLDDAEHVGDAAEGLVHVQALFLRLDKDGALGLVYFKLAQRLQPPADDLGQACFKLAAVQTFQGHFALVC